MDKRIKAKIDKFNRSDSPFKLRKRKNSNGYTLYYEVSRKGSKRVRNSLSLYIGGTAGSYNEDAHTIDIAKHKLEELNRKYNVNRSLSFLDEREKRVKYREVSFLRLFERYYTERYKLKTTIRTFNSTLYHLKRFTKDEGVKVRDINQQFCIGFRSYLDREDINNNSKNLYLKKFKQVVSEMVDREFITASPIPKRYSFPKKNPDREYLTQAELNKLQKTAMPNDSFDICKAFIFGCLSGLRWGDLKDLKFSDIVDGEIKIKQGKTDEFLRFNLPSPALSIVEEMRIINNDRIFENIRSNINGNIKIKQWAKDAEIKKKVTWHVARHTYACLLLLRGVDIYSLSKLLGHTDIKSTMKYLHVLKEHKDKANEVLSDIFD